MICYIIVDGLPVPDLGSVWIIRMAGEPLLVKLWFYVASLRIESDSFVMLKRDYKSMTDAMSAGTLGGEGQERSQNRRVVVSLIGLLFVVLFSGFHYVWNSWRTEHKQRSHKIGSAAVPDYGGLQDDQDAPSCPLVLQRAQSTSGCRTSGKKKPGKKFWIDLTYKSHKRQRNFNFYAMTLSA